MEEIRKQLFDEFCTHIQLSFQEYCKETGVSDNSESIVTYLIDHQIIKPVTIRHYSISKEYEILLHANDNKKSQTVRLLAGKYNLSERSIWAVVKMIEKKTDSITLLPLETRKKTD